MFNSERIKANELDVYDTIQGLTKRLEEEIKRKGRQTFISDHEILGVVMEEVAELQEAIKHINESPYSHFTSELWDVLIACLWGLISQKAYYQQDVQRAQDKD